MKRLLCFFHLSFMAFACGAPHQEASETSDIAQSEQNILILMYHDIIASSQLSEGLKTAPDDVLLSDFIEQLDWLKAKGYQTISAYELYNHRANSRRTDQKQVLITFDDNYYGIYKHAIPELEKRKMKATIFAHTQYVRPEGQEPDYKSIRPKASWKEMIETETRRGQGELFRFESHTVNHRDLTTLSPEDLKYELCHSKKEIELRYRTALGTGAYNLLAQGRKHTDAQGNKVVSHIAYPVGGYNAAVRHVVEECGYLLGYEVGFQEDFGRTSMALPRLGIGLKIKNLDEFKTAVEGYEQRSR